MKNILMILLIIVQDASHGQDTLTLEDAILAGSKGLLPEGLDDLQWVEGTSFVSYIKDDVLKRSGAGKVADVDLLSLKKLNSSMPKEAQFTSFPNVHWINSNTFDIRKNEVQFMYDLNSQSTSEMYRTLTDAEHLDHYTDHSKLAYTVGRELFIAQAGQKEQIAVTNDQMDGIVNGQAAHRFEFGISKGTFWSPKGNLLAFYRMDESMVTKYELEDISTQPSTFKTIRYPMAGQTSHHVRLGIFDLRTKRTIFLNTGTPEDQYLTNIAWSPDEKNIYVVHVDRSQDHIRVVEYDVKTANATRTLFEERDEQYVEPEHAMQFLKGSNDEFLWMSERDGWQHIYHYSLKKGQLKQLTTGEWEVTEILGQDEKGAHVFFEGTGLNATESHLYSIDIASGTMTQLTKEAGTHHGQLSSDGNLIIDEWSSITVPGRIDIVNSIDGVLMKRMVDAKDPLASKKVGTVELLTIKGDQNQLLHARMIKPSTFQSREKYPVLVYVYNGSHVQLVSNSWLGGAPLWMLHAAERGYIVFTVDGRGSFHRGLEFEQSTFRQLGELEMDDQLRGIDHLKTLPYVDQNKLAVHGWSYGGYMTTSLMTKRAGTFKVGVAGGPVMDWRMYEVMYTERYMDTPQENPEGYEKTSLLDKADKLDGDLLVIHGNQDDVVVPEHSLSFLKACVDSGSQLDFFLYPGHPHNVRGKDRVHLMTKVLDYIDLHLR